MINIFVFRYADPETLDYYLWQTDRPKIILPTARTKIIMLPLPNIQIFFNSLNPVTAEFSTSNFIVLSILLFISQDLAIIQKFQ